MCHFIFVLGHANDDAGKLTETGLSRVKHAASHWNLQPIEARPLIVLTGSFAERFNTTGKPHWQHSQVAMASLGVPIGSICAHGLESTNTVEDAVLVARFLEGKPNSRATVVTSQIHIERSRFIFACLAPTRRFEFIGAEHPARRADVEHEIKALGQLRKQGGVFWEGAFFPLPAAREQ
jgi:uncharacterized SAM-binding protein YcdF (DUF218 family)